MKPVLHEPERPRKLRQGSDLENSPHGFPWGAKGVTDKASWASLSGYQQEIGEWGSGEGVV